MNKKINVDLISFRFFMSTMIFGLLLVVSEVSFGLRDRLMNPPDLVIYTHSELKPLVRQEWREFENQFGRKDRIAIRSLKGSVEQSLPLLPNGIIIYPTALDSNQLSGLLQQEFFVGKKPADVGQLFIVTKTNTPQKGIQFLNYLKSTSAQDIASKTLKKRKLFPS